MSNYIKGTNTKNGPVPFFPADAGSGKFWGTDESGEWGPVSVPPGGSVPSLDEIVAAVLAALPTWDGGVY